MSSVEEITNDASASEGAGTGVIEKGDGRNADTNGDGQLQSSDASPQSPQAVTTFHSQPGYYPYHQHNQTPNSPSSASLGNGGYGIQSLLPLQTGNNGFNRQYNNNAPPLSPGVRDINNGDINLPPASPLFPGTVPLYSTSSEQLDSNAINGGSVFASTTSPSFQYLSGPPPSPVVSYGYPPSIPNSPEARTSWPDRYVVFLHQYSFKKTFLTIVDKINFPTFIFFLRNLSQHLYNPAPASSPHLHGVPIQYQGNIPQTRRTGSFDGGDMLPPSAVDDNSSAMFTTGGNLFSQSWAAPPPDLYTSPSSLQQHLSQQIASPPRAGGMHAREQHLGAPPPGNPYYPAATPGPPIQTTQNNKGPDGANLFIFHIPNHFTNLDMWHLFCHYGNLLSVRIMVEKDTGRSRGFGFVSYDSPDAAAMAIKELNGFVVS